MSKEQHADSTLSEKAPTRRQPSADDWTDPAVCQVLIDAGADIEAKDDMGRTPLHRACKSGDLAVVKMLVKAGARVRARDDMELACIMLASSTSGNTETVRYLAGLPQVDLSHRQGLDDFTALHLAAAKDADVVQVLLDAGADTEAKSAHRQTPLHKASFFGELGIVKLLVRAGADVRAKDRKGHTCLSRASLAGHTEVVRTLLCMPEVEVHHRDRSGNTALHHAVLNKHADVVQVLIDAGADTETKSAFSHTPLHKASDSGALDIVKMLVRAGADVRATDSSGYTCLISASCRGHTDIVRYLVDLPEVDVNHRGNSGHTAIEYARQKGDLAAVHILLEHGAET